MTEHELPRYRFRGNVKPSAEVARPVAAYRNATGDGAARTAAGSSATLDIFDCIDSYGGWWGISATDVDLALKQIGDVDTLFVRLNSPGGEATEGVAIANLLRAHKAQVRVTVYGMAASAASYIAIAGDVVSMGPGSLMFVHDALNIVIGDAADLRKEADTLDTISDSIAGLYVLKAGGTTEQWRAAMHADTWYSAEAAVTAKLADRVGLDPALPDNLPPVEAEEDDDATVIQIDVEISPAARAAARRFDLSMLRNAPAALAATQTPATPPVAPSTEPKEADAMSDTLLQGLRTQLGLPDDADEATVLAANAEALDEKAEVTPTAIAAKYGVPADQVETRLKADASSDADSELTILRRELAKAQGQIGELVSARATDDTEKKASKKRELFAAAFAAGKIGGPSDPERVEFEKDYDEAPAVIERILAGRAAGSKFPVKAAGYGTDETTVTDPAADDNYWLPGARKPAFTHAGD